MGKQIAEYTQRILHLLETLKRDIQHLLFSSVDIASLVYFRIVFGSIMLWEVWRYFEHNWIARYWIKPRLHFTYPGFDWVQPWPGQGMYIHFIGLGILATCILLGLCYRISAVLFCLGFTYIFLLEKARYLNHFYLICLISFLLIFIPSHRLLSLDAWRYPRIQRHTVPAWMLWLLRFQLAIPYFYGGLAKINSDWLQGEPMRMWMAARTDFPIIGSLFTEEWMIYLLSYGGLVLDLLVVPCLIWRKTRPFAFAAAVIFHLMNARLFSIGIFPWFMIGATAMFFPPDWPRRLLWLHRSTEHNLTQPSRRSRPSYRSLTLSLLGTYCALQLLLPFRHYLYPGNVSWTEEGHRFAWHMKLRSKKAKARFTVTRPPNHSVLLIEPKEFMPRWQARKMATRPDMILQFSHFLARTFGQDKPESIEVRADVMASLNGRQYQRLIDPNIDLSKQPRTLSSNQWILPLDIPLSQRRQK